MKSAIFNHFRQKIIVFTNLANELGTRHITLYTLHNTVELIRIK